MRRSRLQDFLSSLLILTVVMAICVYVATRDPSLKATISSALLPNDVIYKLKAGAAFVPIYLLFRYIRHIAPDHTNWLQSIVNFMNDILKMKPNIVQTVLVIIWVGTYYALAISLGSTFSPALGWFVSIVWFLTLLIPIHFLRTKNPHRTP